LPSHSSNEQVNVNINLSVHSTQPQPHGHAPDPLYQKCSSFESEHSSTSIYSSEASTSNYSASSSFQGSAHYSHQSGHKVSTASIFYLISTSGIQMTYALLTFNYSFSSATRSREEHY
jgi:hypothetical protein